MAAGDDDTARMVGSEVGGYPPSDDAVAADDQNVPIIQASAPQSTGAKDLDYPLKSHLKLQCLAPSEIRRPEASHLSSAPPTRPHATLDSIARVQNDLISSRKARHRLGYPAISVTNLDDGRAGATILQSEYGPVLVPAEQCAHRHTQDVVGAPRGDMHDDPVVVAQAATRPPAVR